MENAEVQKWKNECVAFENWFKALGGNIASPEQMTEAFKKIEAKNVSDNRLYELLSEDESCGGCGCSVNGDTHICPYASEINDSDAECNCCSNCTHECAMDI